METSTLFRDFISNNAWAIVLVVASIVAQWSIFTTRLDNIEQQQTTQGDTISTLQTSVDGVQNQYAALSAKIDGINDNVDYIRSRIDKVTN